MRLRTVAGQGRKWELEAGLPQVPPTEDRRLTPLGIGTGWKAWLLVLLLIPGLWTSLIAQSFNIRHYSRDEGVPQSQIRDIHQDRRGYIWLATLGGVARFNGDTFSTLDLGPVLLTLVIHEDRDGTLWFGTSQGLKRYDGWQTTTFTVEDGLPDNTIFALFEDARGRLWIGTARGVGLYNGESFSPAGFQELEGESIQRIAGDQHGCIWIGTDRKGVYLNDGVGLRHFDEDDGLAGSLVHDIAVDSSGRVWVATRGGVSLFDGRGFTAYGTADGLPGSDVFAIEEGLQGRIWFGTNKGLAYFDGERIIPLRNHPSSGRWITSISEDTEGNLWFGTEGEGLFVHSRSPFTHYDSSDGLAPGGVWAIVQEPSGAMLFGSRKGVSRFDGQEFKTFTVEDGMPGEEARAVLIDRQGTVWVGANEGLGRFDGPKLVRPEAPEPLRTVRALMEDHSGAIWVGTAFNGLFRYKEGQWTQLSTQDGLAARRVLGMHQDRSGTYWFSTTRGLNRYDGEALTTLTRADGLTNDLVLDLVEDPDDGLWLATYGGGINYMRLTDNGDIAQVDSFQVEHGLSDNGVVSLHFASDGDLWACTNRGLSRIDVEHYKRTGKKSIRRYAEQEGFQSVECSTHAILEDARGRLWFGTIEGVTRYDPALDVPNIIEPKTYISGLRLFLEKPDWTAWADSVDRWTSLPTGLRLPHHKNHLGFEFEGLSFTVPQKVRFQYKLVGFDRQWSPVTIERRATYANLPPGEYTFLVKASNNSGVWNAVPASFSFAITPPFWQTWWFYIFAVFLGAAGLAAVVHFRTRALSRQRRRLGETVERRTEELQESNHHLRRLKQQVELILDSVAEGLCGVDLEGRIIFANPAFSELTGFGKEQIHGRRLAELIRWRDPLSQPPRQDGSVLVTHSVADSGVAADPAGTQVGEDEFTRRDGTIFPVEYALTQVEEGGKNVGAVLTFRDISEKRKLQSQLLQSQKLKSIGQLAAGIAHEINTPIQFVSDNTRFLQEAFDDLLKVVTPLRGLAGLEAEGADEGLAPLIEDARKTLQECEIDYLAEEIPRAVQESQGGLDRVASIVKAMKEFSHPTANLTPTDLNHLLASTITVARNEWKYVAEMETDFDPDLPLVSCLADEMKQVFLNVIVNAAHAIADKVGEGREERGQINISTRCCGESVEISIRDTGVGIAADIRDHIFNHFFTTKEVGRGTGQGLAIAYNVVAEKHKGAILVDSEVGCGSTFTIRLPLKAS
ncbi:MAG TPA: two-component regulator propeller domain-containing protein [Acidobacteriota bacterium]|nr:two-component regulator propeller domain-containing protein [Acidobacteriota bacterium]